MLKSLTKMSGYDCTAGCVYYVVVVVILCYCCYYIIQLMTPANLGDG